MPYIPIFFGWSVWLYLAVGGGVTGLLWWRRDGWMRAVVSVVIFCCVAYPVQLAGMHECLEGRPPEVLEFVFAGLAASLPWCFGRWKWPIPLGFMILLFAGTYRARTLAHSYHGDHITGNPEFSSGSFWHTSITGQRPRDHEKVKQFRKSFAQEELQDE